MNSLALGQRLKALRSAKKLTMQQVGDVFKINRSSINDWEKGKSRPDQSRLPKLAELFGTTAEFILTGQGPGQLPPTTHKLVGLAGQMVQYVKRENFEISFAKFEMFYRTLKQIMPEPIFEGMKPALVSMESMLRAYELLDRSGMFLARCTKGQTFLLQMEVKVGEFTLKTEHRLVVHKTT